MWKIPFRHVLENIHMNFTPNTVTKSGTATHSGSQSGRKRLRSLAEELNGEEKNDLSCQLDSVNRFLTDLYTHLPIQMFKLRRIWIVKSKKCVNTHKIKAFTTKVTIAVLEWAKAAVCVLPEQNVCHGSLNQADYLNDRAKLNIQRCKGATVDNTTQLHDATVS